MTKVRSTSRTYLRILVVGIVLAGVLVAAFAAVAPAKAATGQSTWVAVDEYDLDPCTYSGVHMTGSLHILYHVTETGNGTLRITDETDAQLTGVGIDLITGEPTGVTYIGATSYHDDFVANVFPASRTLTGNALMISQGAGPNYRSYMLINETYDANGNLTAVKYAFTSSCVG
ncbi:MAG TPA: hypothetical protein VFU88_17360 [Ktedonobacterales bacterium]|nr:hypothetical protein [Ktedonobacterales bacterium]